MDESRIEELIEEILTEHERSGFMNDKELRFVENVERDNHDIHLSGRQIAWLERIYEKMQK